MGPENTRFMPWGRPKNCHISSPEMMRKMADLGRVLGQNLAPKNGRPGNEEMMRPIRLETEPEIWNRKMGPENTRFMPWGGPKNGHISRDL